MSVRRLAMNCRVNSLRDRGFLTEGQVTCILSIHVVLETVYRPTYVRTYNAHLSLSAFNSTRSVHVFMANGFRIEGKRKKRTRKQGKLNICIPFFPFPFLPCPFLPFPFYPDPMANRSRLLMIRL